MCKNAIILLAKGYTKFFEKYIFLKRYNYFKKLMRFFAITNYSLIYRHRIGQSWSILKNSLTFVTNFFLQSLVEEICFSPANFQFLTYLCLLLPFLHQKIQFDWMNRNAAAFHNSELAIKHFENGIFTGKCIF